ncbi:MAG: response regulator [Bacteroidota bacterium]|jgi:CheY-like chemotaxis protein
MTGSLRKALVVDDNAINLKVAVKMLERLNYHSDTAVNGAEAVELFKQHRYDVILMDIQMPVMDGFEAVRTMRTLEGTVYHTTIIALTANTMAGDRERCLQAGMDDYLAKPVKQTDINGIIEKWSVPAPHSGFANIHSDVGQSSIIDPGRLDEIRDIGGDELIRELLTLFLQDLEQCTAEIVRGTEAKDLQTVNECAHKLKGSAANLGIESLRMWCESVEQSARDQQLEAVIQQIVSLDGMKERIRSYITSTHF